MPVDDKEALAIERDIRASMVERSRTRLRCT